MSCQVVSRSVTATLPKRQAQEVTSCRLVPVTTTSLRIDIMPPLPNTYDDETTSLIESVQRRQNDLSEFQIPRLRDCKGPLAIQQNLAAELREDIDIISRQIEVNYWASR